MKAITIILICIGSFITGYMSKPRQESAVEKNARENTEWVNTPNHFVIKWEDGRRDSIYSFERCQGASKSDCFTIRRGDWQHMETVKPTCDYTVEKL